MLKFNNTHIFTNYLKQFLHEFNLPTCRVYSMEQFAYNKITGNELNILETRLKKDKSDEISRAFYFPYIKDNMFQEYIEAVGTKNKWVPIKNYQYFYNKPILGFTKNLIIKDNIYDNYTHEYLGNFLRFQRDYNHLNLMSLYNCYSGVTSGTCNIKIKKDVSNNLDIIATFDGMDKKYKIFMLPVKLFNKYTIAIDSNSAIELCCGFFGKYQDTSELTDMIAKATYVKINGSKFNIPFIYDKLFENSELKPNLLDYAQREADLKLFIKVPFNNSSTLTVLEGDYIGYNDSVLFTNSDNADAWKQKRNHTVTNYEEDSKHPKVSMRPFKAVSQLQLLKYNTGESYPFADRLIEYMLGNVITEYNRIEEDIKRVQRVMELNGIKFSDYGVWENKIKNIAYDYMFDHHETMSDDINHDLLGYIDKDVEKFYSGNDLGNKVTLTSVDLYPEMYNKEKK